MALEDFGSVHAAPEWGTYSVTAPWNAYYAAHDICWYDHGVLLECYDDAEYLIIMMAVLHAQMKNDPKAVSRAVGQAIAHIGMPNPIEAVEV